MKIAFMIPAEQTKSGDPGVATILGRVIIATTPEELSEVPSSWTRLDLGGDGAITVTDWLRMSRGDQ